MIIIIMIILKKNHLVCRVSVGWWLDSPGTRCEMCASVSVCSCEASSCRLLHQPSDLFFKIIIIIIIMIIKVVVVVIVLVIMIIIITS